MWSSRRSLASCSALYNTGFQANQALAVVGHGGGNRLAHRAAHWMSRHPAQPVLTACWPAWRTVCSISCRSTSRRWLSGGIWEVDVRHGAPARGERGVPGDLDALHALILPATAPLVAGGPGHHLWCGDRQRSLWRHRQELPEPGALTGRAFLYFAYPAQMSGDSCLGSGRRASPARPRWRSLRRTGYQALAARGMDLVPTASSALSPAPWEKPRRWPV